MKVEIWSDILCPFCYIGKRRFEKALEQFPHKENVEIIYRSFELNPAAPKHYDGNMHTLLANKYGISYEEAKANNDNVAKQAASLGLIYNFDTIIPTNSFDAHRLIHFAATKGKMAEMVEHLFIAYFIDSKNISDIETLTDIAAQIGLDKSETIATLQSDAYANEVRADEQEGSALNITGVPFFVLNRKFAVSGAQPTDVFLNALQKAWEDEQPLEILNDAMNEEGCSDGACAVPNHKKK